MVKEVKIKICPTMYAQGYKPLKYLPDDFVVSRGKETFSYGKDGNKGGKDAEKKAKK